MKTTTTAVLLMVLSGPLIYLLLSKPVQGVEDTEIWANPPECPADLQ